MGTEFGICRAVVLVVLLASAVGRAESWELSPAVGNVPGRAEIEAGRIDDAIRILTTELESGVAAFDVALLDNLCVVYAMKLEYDKAMRYCNEAMWYASASATALNNRGVLRAVMGDLHGAVQDFRRASCVRNCDRGKNCGDDSLHATVMRNFARAKKRGASSTYVAVMYWPAG